MIPEVLVGDGMRRARALARRCAAQVAKETGCHMVAVVAEMGEEGRACTSMTVDPTLEHDPGTEIALMKCALARLLSLLALHVGAKEAVDLAIAAAFHGALLAKKAEDEADASG